MLASVANLDRLTARYEDLRQAFIPERVLESQWHQRARAQPGDERPQPGAENRGTSAHVSEASFGSKPKNGVGRGKDLVRGAQKLDCSAPGSGFQRKQAQLAEKGVMLQ